MKTMMRKLKLPSGREDLQSGIIDFITAPLPSLVAPLVCRFSLAGSAWSLSSSVRQKNVCATQKTSPSPPRLPPSLPPLSPSYVKLLDDPQALFSSIHHLIRNIQPRKRQTPLVLPPTSPPENLKGLSLMPLTPSSSDHPSITAPKAPPPPVLSSALCFAAASIVNANENKGRESESWEGWQAGRGGGGRVRRGECALSVIRPGRGPPTLGCGNSIAASWFLQRWSSSWAWK